MRDSKDNTDAMLLTIIVILLIVIYGTLTSK